MATIDIKYPCPACGAQAWYQGQYKCPVCFEVLEDDTYYLCTICGYSENIGGSVRLCNKCRDEMAEGMPNYDD